MTPERVDEWISIFRDIALVLLAVFMLLFETVFAHEVNPYIVGAGLTLAGVPPALRLDTKRRRRSNGNSGSEPHRVEPDDALRRITDA